MFALSSLITRPWWTQISSGVEVGQLINYKWFMQHAAGFAPGCGAVSPLWPRCPPVTSHPSAYGSLHGVWRFSHPCIPPAVPRYLCHSCMPAPAACECCRAGRACVSPCAPPGEGRDSCRCCTAPAKPLQTPDPALAEDTAPSGTAPP